MAKRLVAVFALFAMTFSLTAIGFAQESTVKGNLGWHGQRPKSGAVVGGANVTIVGPNGRKNRGHGLGRALSIPSADSRLLQRKDQQRRIQDGGDKVGRSCYREEPRVSALKLELGTSATTIEVNASSIEVDTTSTAVGSNMTDTFYQSVPVATRRTGLFYAAPGVSSGGGTGTANPSIAGGTGLENNYIADGVSITDGGFGGIGVFRAFTVRCRPASTSPS